MPVSGRAGHTTCTSCGALDDAETGRSRDSQPCGSKRDRLRSLGRIGDVTIGATVMEGRRSLIIGMAATVRVSSAPFTY